jgi:4-hydroxythreonine-4-phosphate dehydrogenase
MAKIVFTCGDVNGIGPEISVKLFNRILSGNQSNQFIFICPKNVFEYYYKLTQSKFQYCFQNNPSTLIANRLTILPIKNVKFSPGKVTKFSGITSYNSIIEALELIMAGKADAMVTSPISKEAISLAGINFPGHTELLAFKSKEKKYLMFFLSSKVNAALLTIHEPLKKVSSIINKNKIVTAIELLDESAKMDLGIRNPKIAVLGLNPHAGENSLIGNEEHNVIHPAIISLQNKIDVKGPFVPDAFWGNHNYKKYDAVLGMYHDQILIPFKLLNFNSGVNFTAGLEIIRTSPDHGTAFDIAGKNIANESSLYEAYKYAIKILRNRKKYLASNKPH